MNIETNSKSPGTPLAIVGMALRVPGANGLDAFWQLLIEGQSAVGPLPPDRFDRELYYDPRPGVRNKSYTDLGAIVSHEDAAFSPIPPKLARQSDITHRILCDVAADALRHAGLDPNDLPSRNTGVYVGHTIGSELAGDANDASTIEETLACLCEPGVADELGPSQKEALIQKMAVAARIRRQSPAGRAGDENLASHRAAGVISKAFGLTGPYVCVNAACASSLAALVLAGRSLQQGQIDMALVGGASICGRDWLVLFSQSTALSATGSRPFDERADGLVVAEAYVALVVKTLERALSDGSPIQAVIRGFGMSTDGKGRSLWAPRSEGQVAAIRRAYGRGVEPADVQYVEAHATATQLGDATEIESLRSVFGGLLPRGEKLPIGSVKANIGHALEAAGLVGVVKSVLCMQKGLIPPAINIERLNPNIDWANVPFVVPRYPVPWPATRPGSPRRAGVNAFGIGGLNVHVVLDSFHSGQATIAVKAHASRVRPDEPIAIVGLGSVIGGTTDVDEFRQLSRSGRGRVPKPFQYDWRRHRIPPKEIELADRLQFLMLEAADQALADAGYDAKPFDRERTGVVVGAEFAGGFYERLQLALRLPRTQELLREELASVGIADARAAEIARDFADSWHAKWPVLADNTGSFSTSSLAVRIAKSWNLMGGAAALDSGPTSGLAALAASMNLLRAGDCDAILCGAVVGDGAVVLLLKRLSDARPDGDRVHAIVQSVAAWHDVAGDAVSRSLRAALDRADCQPRDLSFVICDGSGGPDVGQRLARAVIASQRMASRPEPLLVGSMAGPTGGASLLAAVLAMRAGELPGGPGGLGRSPMAEVSRNQNIVRCAGRATTLRRSAEGGALKAAVVSQHDGLAYCAVIEQGIERRNPTLGRDKQIPNQYPAAAGERGLVGQLVIEELIP